MKTLLIVIGLFLFCLEPLFACSYDTRVFLPIVQDYNNARTIMVVTVKRNSKDKKIFVADKQWGEISFEEGLSCKHVVSENQKYVLLSYLTIDELKQSKLKLSNVILKVFSDDLVGKISELTNRANARFFWGYCAKDGDCTLSRNGCSVNSKYKDIFDQFYGDTKCDSAKSICLNGQCK